MNNNLENICIYGIGGVGGYFGGKMLQNNTREAVKISFIARGAHLQEIKNNGLILNSNGEKIVAVPHKAVENINDLDNVDLIILCVKSYGLIEALDKIKEKVSEDTIILPLLNGIDIYQRIRKIIKTGIVLPACVYVGTHIERPGVITQNGGDGKILFGMDPERPDYGAQDICKLLSDLNINYKYEENPYAEIWTKFMFIASYGLVCTSAGKTLGQILDDNTLFCDVRGIMNEIKAIANKKGIPLDEGVVEASLAKAKAFPYDVKTSYHRDVEAGRANEGDLFGGAIIRLGNETGVCTDTTKKYYSI